MKIIELIDPRPYYSGTNRRFRLSGCFERDIQSAVEDEHPCEYDCSCDIAAALRAGFPFVAAWHLSGATETYLLDAVREAYAFNGDIPAGCLLSAPNPFEHPEFEEWVKWFRDNSVECPACGAFNFTDEDTPEFCGNCSKSLPQPEDEDEDGAGA